MQFIAIDGDLKATTEGPFPPIDERGFLADEIKRHGSPGRFEVIERLEGLFHEGFAQSDEDVPIGDGEKGKAFEVC